MHNKYYRPHIQGKNYTIFIIKYLLCGFIIIKKAMYISTFITSTNFYIPYKTIYHPLFIIKQGVIQYLYIKNEKYV